MPVPPGFEPLFPGTPQPQPSRMSAVPPGFEPLTPQGPPGGGFGFVKGLFDETLGQIPDLFSLLSNLSGFKGPEVAGRIGLQAVKGIHESSVQQGTKAAELFMNRENRPLLRDPDPLPIPMEGLEHGIPTSHRIPTFTPEGVEFLGRIGGSIPLLGPAAASIGEEIGQGNFAHGLGRGTGLILSTLFPRGSARAADAAVDAATPPLTPPAPAAMMPPGASMEQMLLATKPGPFTLDDLGKMAGPEPAAPKGVAPTEANMGPKPPKGKQFDADDLAARLIAFQEQALALPAAQRTPQAMEKLRESFMTPEEAQRAVTPAFAYMVKPEMRTKIMDNFGRMIEDHERTQFKTPEQAVQAEVEAQQAIQAAGLSDAPAPRSVAGKTPQSPHQAKFQEFLRSKGLTQEQWEALPDKEYSRLQAEWKQTRDGKRKAKGEGPSEANVGPKPPRRRPVDARTGEEYDGPYKDATVFLSKNPGGGFNTFVVTKDGEFHSAGWIREDPRTRNGWSDAGEFREVDDATLRTLQKPHLINRAEPESQPRESLDSLGRRLEPAKATKPGPGELNAGPNFAEFLRSKGYDPDKPLSSPEQYSKLRREWQLALSRPAGSLTLDQAVEQLSQTKAQHGPVAREARRMATETPNASGESAASAEAISRQSSMKAKGEQFVVYNRQGIKRPLIGPDAVDYKVRAGETYGVEGPKGFRVLDDKGGRYPKTTRKGEVGAGSGRRDFLKNLIGGAAGAAIPGKAATPAAKAASIFDGTAGKHLRVLAEDVIRNRKALAEVAPGDWDAEIKVSEAFEDFLSEADFHTIDKLGEDGLLGDLQESWQSAKSAADAWEVASEKINEEIGTQTRLQMEKEHAEYMAKAAGPAKTPKTVPKAPRPPSPAAPPASPPPAPKTPRKARPSPPGNVERTFRERQTRVKGEVRDLRDLGEPAPITIPKIRENAATRFVEATVGGGGPFRRFRESQAQALDQAGAQAVRKVSREAELYDKKVLNTLKSGDIKGIKQVMATTDAKTLQRSKAKLLADMIESSRGPRPTTTLKGPVEIVKGQKLRGLVERKMGRLKMETIFNQRELEAIDHLLKEADAVGHTPSSFQRWLIGISSGITAPGLAPYAALNVAARIMTTPWGSKALREYMRAAGTAGKAGVRTAQAGFWAGRVEELARQAAQEEQDQ